MGGNYSIARGVFENDNNVTISMWLWRVYSAGGIITLLETYYNDSSLTNALVTALIWPMIYIPKVIVSHYQQLNLWPNKKIEK